MLRPVKLFIIIGVLSLSTVHGTPLSEPESTLPISTEETKLPEPEKVEYQPTIVREEPPSTLDLMGRIFIYLALLAAIGGVFLHFFRQGKFIKGIRDKGNLLKVSETHMLGNKQFLVVVEYGEQKVLLGVGPGMINKLCFLDAVKKDTSSAKEINT